MILLFGSTGFIGRHVKEALGDDVVEAPDDRADLTSLLYEVAPDAVVNCAARTTGDATALVRANVAGLARLLGAVTTAAPRARFVQL
ncbi:MAG: NAD(P)-dependent oxidoreductase, partial [Nonomuraea sp.]|nr:NAD(P)-dependent oxidoreductase [Nonomuraea sp.]